MGWEATRLPCPGIPKIGWMGALGGQTEERQPIEGIYSGGLSNGPGVCDSGAIVVDCGRWQSVCEVASVS